MIKPRVPAYHIIYEGLDDDLFLGDRAAQERLVQTIVKGVKEGAGGMIYAIVGPTRTGKGTAFKQIADQVRDANVFISGNFGGSESERQAFAESTHAKKVIRLSTDVDPSVFTKHVEEARVLLSQSPGASIIIDALVHEPRFPNPSRRMPPSVANDLRMFDEITKSRPEVVVLRTGHDIHQVKEALWKLNTQLAENFSGTGNAIRADLLDGQRGKYVDAVVAALNANDKEAYDHAFQWFVDFSTHPASDFASSATGRRTSQRGR